MICSRNSLFTPVLALVLIAAGAAAWTVGLWPGALALRAAASAVWFLIIGSLVCIAIRSAARPWQEAHRMLDNLSRMSFDELSTAAQNNELPQVPSSHPLAAVIERLRATLSEAHERVDALQHQRNAVEIRARRQEAQAERMAAILASLPEPVLVVDSYDELLLANSSARKLFSLAEEPLERRVVTELVRCEKLLELLQETRRKKTAAARSDEVQLPAPDGREHWYSITASPIQRESSAAADSPGGTMVVLRDISHQKQIQKRNAEFVSAVSHEMKAPLAGIKAYVEMLADGEADDAQTQEEFLGVINSQADRLKRLIDNLLNLARIESGVVQVHKAPCSLNELLEEAFSVIRPAAEEKQLELAAELSPMYLNVNVDRDQMLQAAINLLSNAVKYTPRGGKVTLRSRLEERHAQFDVEDSGVGLSPEDSERVFEKFYRVQKDQHMAAGTGLGLPLAKYIVEDMHGGRLTVRSQVGAGSTFTVSLPIAGKDE
jgi:two-component system phosphate regulon sensor histidine kinase PhoR